MHVSWIRRQVQYWMGASYEAALLDEWGGLRFLLDQSGFGQSINGYLQPRDLSEELVAEKYGDFGRYRFKDNALVMQEWARYGGAEYLERDIIVPILMVDIIGPNLPVVGYNRSRVHDGVCSLLWPLELHRQVARSGLNDILPFDEKVDRLLFRGAFSGNQDRIEDGRFIKFSRLEILEKVRNAGAIADVGFTHVPDETKPGVQALDMTDRVAAMIVPFIDFGEILNSKYVLCLEGADISTAFGGVLASKAVPVHTYPFNFEVWYFNDLLPWVHFVPIARDGSNVAEVMAFCARNPNLMASISTNGREHMKRMLDDDYLDEIKAGVVKNWTMPRVQQARV